MHQIRPGNTGRCFTIIFLLLLAILLLFKTYIDALNHKFDRQVARQPVAALR